MAAYLDEAQVEIATADYPKGRVMSVQFSESVVEEAALGWLENMGYQVLHGPDIGPDGPQAERARHGWTIESNRLTADYGLCTKGS